MSWADIATLVKTGGPPAVILLIAFSAILFSRKLRFPDEILYRDDLIDKLNKTLEGKNNQIDKLNENFALAIRTIKEDLVPLLEKALDELKLQQGRR